MCVCKSTFSVRHTGILFFAVVRFPLSEHAHTHTHTHTHIYIYIYIYIYIRYIYKICDIYIYTMALNNHTG